MWPYETGACRCLLMSQVNKAEILINRWFCVTEIGNGSKLKEVSIVLAVDYFLWDEVLPLAEKKEPGDQVPVTVTPKTASDSKSLHEERVRR